MKITNRETAEVMLYIALEQVAIQDVLPRDGHVYFYVNKYQNTFRWHITSGVVEEESLNDGYVVSELSTNIKGKLESAFIKYYINNTECTDVPPSPFRRVKFNRWIPRELEFAGSGKLNGTKPGTNCFEKDYPNEGLFHSWGSAYEEFDTGPGNYSVAIVELPDGRVEKVLPHNIKFVS